MAKSAGFAAVPRTENVMKKVLIANSGEIACRIVRACQKLDLASVPIHPQIDVNALHVVQADEAVRIEAAKPVASYLDSDAIAAAPGDRFQTISEPLTGFVIKPRRAKRSATTCCLPKFHNFRIVETSAAGPVDAIGHGLPVPGLSLDGRVDATGSRIT
jgi:hypothetical protein